MTRAVQIVLAHLLRAGTWETGPVGVALLHTR
jgi:hypothetical protein